jgi:uncharacterized protein YodC (DUF2158 family)
MTVAEIGGNEYVLCEWFDDKNQSQTKAFTLGVLKIGSID